MNAVVDAASERQNVALGPARSSSIKRVLLVAYYFPPQPFAGSLRLGYLARYLPEFGWQPTVLTRAWPGESNISCETLRVPALFGPYVPPAGGQANHKPRPALRLIPASVKDAIAFPDRAAGWLAPALASAWRITRATRFDAIVSSSHPPSAHVVAGIVARARGIPWLADYRDPWHGDRYAEKSRVRTALEDRLELRLLRRARAISTVSDEIAKGLEDFHRRDGVAVIPNACDPSDWDLVPDAVPVEFRLCYTGILYQGRRGAGILLGAIARLRDEHDDAGNRVRLDVYGPDAESLRNTAVARGVADAVRLHGWVPRHEALRAQRASAGLVVLLNMDEATSGEIGSKIFEYAGARRPIIAIGPPNSVVRPFLERSGLGLFASDEAQCAVALRRLYQDFARGRFEPERRDDVKLPVARDLAASFASALDAIGNPG